MFKLSTIFQLRFNDASYWQTLSHNVVLGFELTTLGVSNICEFKKADICVEWDFIVLASLNQQSTSKTYRSS